MTWDDLDLIYDNVKFCKLGSSKEKGNTCNCFLKKTFAAFDLKVVDADI